MFKNLLQKRNQNDFGEIVSKVNDNITLYKTNVTKLENKINCINWNKNRPYDKVRVNDIKKYYLNNMTTILPGIIYGWKNNQTLEIYDGIHRLLAASDIKSIDILIQIYDTDNELLIVEDFKNINKSISVPIIYLEENNYVKRRVCEHVTKYLCEKFPRCVSASKNCQQQNFNRDNLIDFISKLQIDFEVKNIESIIIQELVGLNYQAQDYVRKHNIPVPQKSHFNKFYLFFLQEAFIKDMLEKSVKIDY